MIKSVNIYFKLFLILILNQYSSHAFGVIYGQDDRRDMLNLDSFIRSRSNGTAILMELQRVKEIPDSNPKRYRLSSLPLDEKFRLCKPEDEPFAKQPTPGFCSGFLMAPDIIVTAGHCVPTISSCHQTAIVFGFSNDNPQESDITNVPESNIYSCKEIKAQKLDPNSGLDYAIIQLDRPVVGRTPLAFHKTEGIAVGDPVFAIGYPHGGPAKYIAGAYVREAEPSKSCFVSNIDGFEGNSGSPVFNKTGLVEGFIVRGEESYKTISQGEDQCLETIQCDNDACRGEDVLKINEIMHLVPVAGPAINVQKVTIDDSQHGNGNGFAEPGETVKLSIEIMNTGRDEARRLTFQLMSPNHHVKFEPLYLDPNEVLKPGETTVIKDAVMTISPDTDCQTSIPVNLMSFFSGPSNYWSSSFNIDLGSQELAYHSLEFGPDEGQLPSYSNYGVSFRIPDIESPQNRKVMFLVDVTHPRPNQMIISVNAPDEKYGFLYKSGYPSPEIPVPNAPTDANGIYGLNKKPYNDIDHFSRVKDAGEWYFTIKDTVQGSAGKVNKLSVIYAHRVCSSTSLQQTPTQLKAKK